MKKQIKQNRDGKALERRLREKEKERVIRERRARSWKMSWKYIGKHR